MDVKDVWKHLRVPDATWDQLMQYTVKRLTVMADRNVRSAVVARLMESDIEQGGTEGRRKRVQAFFAKVGARSAYQSLGSLSPQDNLTLFRTMEV